MVNENLFIEAEKEVEVDIFKKYLKARLENPTLKKKDVCRLANIHPSILNRIVKDNNITKRYPTYSSTKRVITPESYEKLMINVTKRKEASEKKRQIKEEYGRSLHSDKALIAEGNEQNETNNVIKEVAQRIKRKNKLVDMGGDKNENEDEDYNRITQEYLQH